MATAAHEHVDLTPFVRREKLQSLARAASSLAVCAEAGQDDHLLAAQVALTVRRFAHALDGHPGCEDVSREIDSLGMQIQFAGRGLRGTHQ